jgi:hypothetical protein
MQKDNAIQHQSITNSQVVVDEIEMLVLVQIVQYSFKTDKRKRGPYEILIITNRKFSLMLFID